MTVFLWILSVAQAEPCADVVAGRLRAAEAGLAFVSGKADLVEGADEALNGIACRLERDPSLSLQIAVHTDAQGSDSFNLRLSQARAEAVRAALQARGIDAARLHPAGFGESRPLAPNSTVSGRATNRRVELWVDPARWDPAPAPEPPPPVPAPAPADPCVTWRPVLSRCLAERWCEVELPPARSARLAARCLGATEPPLQDGEAFYVRLPQGVLEVKPSAGASALRLSEAAR